MSETVAAAAPALAQEQLLELLSLMKDADSVELKVSVDASAQRSAVQALDIDPLGAQVRLVHFFDTPDLALEQAGVVVRARRVQGRADDTVVKLRPVNPAELPKRLRRHPEFVVEVDAMTTGYVCSGSFKGVAAESVRESHQRGGPLRKLFTKEQRAFYAEHAPEGIGLDDLVLLGPIFVLKMKGTPAAFGRKLVVEMWLYPDGTRILELSTKCSPSEGFQVAAEARAFLGERGIAPAAHQLTKTRKALSYFSQQLRGDDGGVPINDAEVGHAV
jgi:hypothetical protein